MYVLWIIPIFCVGVEHQDKVQPVDRHDNIFERMNSASGRTQWEIAIPYATSASAALFRYFCMVRKFQEDPKLYANSGWYYRTGYFAFISNFDQEI